MRLITKYPNRKLYDTTISSYVTSKHLVEYIHDDIQFQVIDKETKKDITNDTLKYLVNCVKISSDTLINLLVRSQNKLDNSNLGRGK